MHHPSVGEPPYREDCDCRKPKPGLLKQAGADLDIDLRHSYVIGDRQGDVELAWKVGARGVLVKTGYGLGESTYGVASWARPPDMIAEHLLEAVQRIVAETRDRA